MALVFLIFAVLFWLPFEDMPLVTAGVFIALFPLQLILWSMYHGRKAKDFFFCFSVVILNVFLKHFFGYSDTIFYVLGILLSAVLRYRIFLAVSGAACAMEILREFFLGTENPDDIAFRYLLFLAAGTVTYLLLWEEKRQKEGYKKELDDLKYGIQQVEDTSSVALSDSEQISRSVDAALALDESLNRCLQLIHSIFKPERAMLWQMVPEKGQLRVRNRIGCEGLPRNLAVSLGEGPIGWAALNKKTFLQQDRDTPIQYAPFTKKQPVKSLIAIPVLDADKVEGVISLDSSHMNYFSSDSETALRSFAQQIAEMIRMARLAKEREERAFEFQAFYHASKDLSSLIDFDETIRKLHQLANGIVPSDWTAIVALNAPANNHSVYLWEAEQEAPKIFSDLSNDGHTWISWFCTNREEPLIVSDSQLKLQDMPLLHQDVTFSEMASTLAVPMRHQQKCIGALLLGSRHKDAFSAHQAHVLSILCNQAAVSLENSTIIEKMEELAITDGLTGLFNHRYFQHSIQTEIERAERQDQSLSLLIMDIDHFKGFNDSFGHQAGDFVLKSLADLLKSNIRKIDILARYGGEEFAALLPGIDSRNARKTAERWRKAVQRANFKWEGKSFAITMSIGVATFPDDAREKIELIEKSDAALYRAKENGRNQVQHWADEQERKSSLFGL